MTTEPTNLTAAIEAAAEALAGAGDWGAWHLRKARIAVEAAAPHLADIDVWETKRVRELEQRAENAEAEYKLLHKDYEAECRANARDMEALANEYARAEKAEAYASEFSASLDAWRDRAEKAEAALQASLTTSAQMSSPAGLLPINSEGMRTAVDAWSWNEAEIDRFKSIIIRQNARIEKMEAMSDAYRGEAVGWRTEAKQVKARSLQAEEDAEDWAVEAKAERALADQLAAALKVARDDIKSWGAYAAPYFQERWNLTSDVAACDTALADYEEARS